VTGTAADVIRVATSQVGYHEGYSGGHWTNLQRYSPAVPGLEWSQNQAWCQTFATWSFQEAGMPKGAYLVTASCALAVAWWKKANRFSTYPAVGAQVFFGPGGGSHTGLVYAYDATYIYTVEGNTNTSGSAEGDGVYLKKRARRDTYVYGYGYPAYPAGIVTADPAWKNPAPTPQEIDMTPDQAAQLQKLHDNLLQIGSLTEKDAKGNPVVHGAGYYLAHIHYDALKIVATEAAQTAALTALATAIGKVDAAIDVPALVAEVKAAIEAAVSQVVIHLDVPDVA